MLAPSSLPFNPGRQGFVRPGLANQDPVFHPLGAPSGNRAFLCSPLRNHSGTQGRSDAPSDGRPQSRLGGLINRSLSLFYYLSHLPSSSPLRLILPFNPSFRFATAHSLHQLCPPSGLTFLYLTFWRHHRSSETPYTLFSRCVDRRPFVFPRCDRFFSLRV